MNRPRRTRRSPARSAENEGRTPRPRIRARGPADLLALIPFQLGFHPVESAVTVFLRSGQVKMTARVDLPPPSAAAEFARQIRGLVRQHDVDELVLFAYSAQPDPARALLAGLVQALPARLVRDALYVDGSRWWSLTCDQTCCPAAGTPYDIASHPLAAEAVYAGMTARATRDELAALLDGPAEAEIARLDELAAQVLKELEHLARPRPAADYLVRMVRTGMADPNGLDDRTCAALAVLVTDLHLRDLAWAMISPDDAEDHVEVWLRVVNRVPPKLSAAPLALVGMAGWIGGHGALLNCCADRIRNRHPGYSMGRLLAQISDGAVSPSVWDTVGGHVQAELRRELDGLTGEVPPGPA
jgi:hypothetical protein